MPTPAENFDTDLKTVLYDRVCGFTDVTAEDVTLTEMDGYWAVMSPSEKQAVVDYFTSSTAPGARVRVGEGSFPTACYTLPETFHGLTTRYTV